MVEDGQILAAEIERDDPYPRAGAVLRARYEAPLVGRRSILVKLDGGGEAMLEPVPAGIGPGSRLTVEVVRQWFVASDRASKAMKVRAVPDDTALRDGPSLRDRITQTGLPIRHLRAFEPDLLEQAGWSELLEEARTGRVDFPGGSLDIQLASAMTLIDVNGAIEPGMLAIEGAKAAARAINRLRLSGSIGIDLPTVADRAVRKRAAEALDELMRGPFERTAVNGFGFLQVVRRQSGPSLMHLMQGERGRAEALALLRRAERDPHPGPIELIVPTDVPTSFGAQELIRELEKRRGREARWRGQPGLAVGNGSVRPIIVASDMDSELDDDHE